MPQKVLFTASTFSHIRNFHRPYLRAFRERGWEVHVACGGEPGELPEADRLIRLPFEKSMSSPQNFRAAAQIRSLVRREGYALVCTHTALAAFFTRLALKALPGRPRLVNMVHGYLFDDETAPAKRGILLEAERLTAAQTDLLLTMNDYDRRAAERHRLGRDVVHIPGVGVDFSRFDELPPEAGSALRESLGIPEEAFVLFYAAEFSGRKNQQTLIRAMTRLPERAVLVLAGEGALREDCKALAASLGLGERVLFPGQVSVPPWYAMADAAVSASRIEGLPFNVMEAMYMGLPVVASAVKGHTDLIRSGENGLLYPFGDEAACAAAISELMDSPALCRRLGGEAAADAAAYSLDRVFPRVWAQYAALAEIPEPVPTR